MPDFSITSGFLALAERFLHAGARLYGVGGMVRNPLLSLPVSDMDVCSALPPQEVKALCAGAGIGCKEKGAAFGTLDLTLGGERFEYACFRADSYGASGAHRPRNVRFTQSLEEDAIRRDFTLNALYLDPLTGRVTDPTGGLADLAAKRIRATSPNPGDILRDDGLRILRMARFAAELGFLVEPATLAAAREHVGGLADISPERIAEEWNKLLLSDVRYGMGKESLLYGLHTLKECGVFPVILPELACCDGITQKAQYHAYDVLEHCLHACASAPPQLNLRLAMLLHDTGKPVALAHHGKMHGHEAYSAAMAEDILTRLKYPIAQTKEVVELIRRHMFRLKGGARPRTIKKRFVQLGKERALQLCAVREADVHGSGIITDEVATAARWREILDEMEQKHAPFSQSELACTGADIALWLNLPPGPKIGQIKRGLLLHCACKPEDNTPERLRALAKDIAGGYDHA